MELPVCASGCSASNQCSECHGDCDNDGQCKFGLKCYERDGDTKVPGCGKGGSGDVEDYDYCYQWALHAAGKYCVHIVTGTGSGDPGGYVSVKVDVGGGLVQEVSGGDYFYAGYNVLSKCYSTPLVEVQLQNKYGDGWRGQVGYSVDDGASYTHLECEYCSQGGSSEDVAVDGDGDVAAAATQCKNGMDCHFLPPVPAAAATCKSSFDKEECRSKELNATAGEIACGSDNTGCTKKTCCLPCHLVRVDGHWKSDGQVYEET